VHFIPIRHDLSSVWTVPARTCGALGAHIFLSDVTWKLRSDFCLAMPRCSELDSWPRLCGFNMIQHDSTGFPLHIVHYVHWTFLRNRHNADQWSTVIRFCWWLPIRCLDALAWQPALLAEMSDLCKTPSRPSLTGPWQIGSVISRCLSIIKLSCRLSNFDLVLFVLSFATSQVIFFRAPIQTLEIWGPAMSTGVCGTSWSNLITLWIWIWIMQIVRMERG